MGDPEENYQVRELAEIVRDVVPDSTVEFGGSSDPDPRSYRVDFESCGARCRASRRCAERATEPRSSMPPIATPASRSTISTDRASPGSSGSRSCAAKEARPRSTVARVIFTELELPGAYVVDVETDEDERGHFARIFDDAEFGALDLQTYWPQISVAFNEELGTPRGLHYQEQPHAEAKLVRCVRGSLHDVIVDLRAGSTFKRWAGVRSRQRTGACSTSRKASGHGYLTLEDETEALYPDLGALRGRGRTRSALGRPGVRHRVAGRIRG